VTQDDATSQDRAKAQAKGRATPSRKEAEAARKKAMKTPMTRKEQMQRERQARADLRRRQQEALRAGRGDALPPRDRGPVRAFARDYVDRRRNVAEYLLPILVVVFVLIYVPTPWAQLVSTFGWMLLIILTVIDEILLVGGLRKQLKLRFPDQSTRGAVGYAVLRSTQLRRIRLPKPAIGRGEDPRERV
jgi:hypothetical protein